MKRIMLMVIILIFGFITGNLWGKEILLKIPVYVSSSDNALKNLTMSDFQLTVNDKKEEPVNLIGNFRSLSYPAIKRNFILAFNISEYSQQISDGITAFIHGILKQGDAIIVWTPVKVHRINVFKDKTQTCSDIEEIVKKDTLDFKKDLKNAVDSLERIFRRYNDEVAENFLNEFGREFNNYKSRFILPNLLKTSSVVALFDKEEGENWLINFQEREIIPFIANYRNIANQIRDHASNLAGHDQTRASVLYTALTEIDKMMLFSENFPLQQIVESLVAQSFNYNVILFKNLRRKAEMGDTSSPDLEKILREISACTGGTVTVNPDLKDGLVTIGESKSVFYQLNFKFDEKKEDKQIKITLSNPQYKAWYKKHFSAKEIEKFLADSKESRIKITGFSVKDRVVKFSIENFKMDTIDNKKQGMLKIQLQLITDTGEITYNTQNVLSTQKNVISISLKMPEKYKGKFTVRISAFDFLSGKITQKDESKKI